MTMATVVGMPSRPASININEVDPDLLVTGQRTNNRAQRRGRTTLTTDDLTNVGRIDAHLKHPAASQVLLPDPDVVRIGDDARDEVFQGD